MPHPSPPAGSIAICTHPHTPSTLASNNLLPNSAGCLCCACLAHICRGQAHLLFAAARHHAMLENAAPVRGRTVLMQRHTQTHTAKPVHAVAPTARLSHRDREGSRPSPPIARQATPQAAQHSWCAAWQPGSAATTSKCCRMALACCCVPKLHSSPTRVPCQVPLCGDAGPGRCSPRSLGGAYCLDDPNKMHGVRAIAAAAARKKCRPTERCMNEATSV